MKRRLVCFLTIILVVLSLVNGCSDQGAIDDGKVIVLKYAFFAPSSTFPAIQMEKWKEELESRTNGAVRVDTFPGGTLLQAQNMYDGVSSGIADIGLSCPSYFPGSYPLLNIADRAFGYPNSKVASLVLYDLIQEFQPKSLENYKVVTAFAIDPVYIMSKERITNLEELAWICYGLKEPQYNRESAFCAMAK